MIVKREDIDCDMYVIRVFDVCFRKEDVEVGKKDYEVRKVVWGEDMVKYDLRVVEDFKEFEVFMGVWGGYWGVSYFVGYFWFYKFVFVCKLYFFCLL